MQKMKKIVWNDKVTSFEKLRKHNGELGLNIGKIRDNANEYMQISRISIICFTNKTKVQKLTKKMSKKKKTVKI